MECACVESILGGRPALIMPHLPPLPRPPVAVAAAQYPGGPDAQKLVATTAIAAGKEVGRAL
jgi:hypothetical protein